MNPKGGNNMNTTKKRGRKGKKFWTLKKITGHYYLYTWEYDKDATEEKKRRMLWEYENGNPMNYKKEDLWTKASCYRWVSHGRWNPEKFSDSILAFLNGNEELLADIQAEYESKI
jgi:hypothetical protein